MPNRSLSSTKDFIKKNVRYSSRVTPHTSASYETRSLNGRPRTVIHVSIRPKSNSRPKQKKSQDIIDNLNSNSINEENNSDIILNSAKQEQRLEHSFQTDENTSSQQSFAQLIKYTNSSVFENKNETTYEKDWCSNTKDFTEHSKKENKKKRRAGLTINRCLCILLCLFATLLLALAVAIALVATLIKPKTTITQASETTSVIMLTLTTTTDTTITTTLTMITSTTESTTQTNTQSTTQTNTQSTTQTTTQTTTTESTTQTTTESTTKTTTASTTKTTTESTTEATTESTTEATTESTNEATTEIISTTSTSPSSSITVNTSMSNYYGKENLYLPCSTPLTNVTIQIFVQRTVGATYNGMSNSFSTGVVTQSHTTTSTQIIYTWTIVPGQIVNCLLSSYNVQAQINLFGTAQVTSADTYIVTTITNAGVTTTSTGHF